MFRLSNVRLRFNATHTQCTCVTAKRGDSDRAMETEPLQTTRQGMSRTDANLTDLRTGTDQKRYGDVNTLDWEIAPFLTRAVLHLGSNQPDPATGTLKRLSDPVAGLGWLYPKRNKSTVRRSKPVTLPGSKRRVSKPTNDTICIKRFRHATLHKVG